MNKKSDKGSKAKSLLEDLISTSHKLAQDTKSGKSHFRHLTPSPPPVIDRLRNKSFTSESEDSEEKPSTYVNNLNGKTEDLILPSFKKYLKHNKYYSENEKLFKKIEKCHQDLNTFEKKINGLENFCKLNPGVLWNNDKAILMKLAGNKYDKVALIKAYNEKQRPLGSASSKRTSLIQRLHSLSPEKKSLKPIAQEKSQTPKIVKKLQKPNHDYLADIKQAKLDLHTKTMKIFNKIKADRQGTIRDKAELIFKDQERYRGRIRIFRQMDSFRRVVETNKFLKLSRCKSQVKVYTSLLDYLQDYKGLPSPAMITFVEAVKDLIEGGWNLDHQNMSQVLQVFDEGEKEEINDLFLIVQRYLDTKHR